MLTATGCDKIFEDKISGVKESRPEWDRLLEFLRPGDTVAARGQKRANWRMPECSMRILTFLRHMSAALSESAGEPLSIIWLSAGRQVAS
jgi:hypothetical protein